MNNDSSSIKVANYPANIKKKDQKNVVRLDNQADVSICIPDVVTNIREAPIPISLHGVNSAAQGMYVDKIGTFMGMFDVYVSENIPANILCMGDIEDMFQVTYVQGKYYSVMTPQGDIMFKRVDKVYKANVKSLIHVKAYTTLSTNQQSSLTKQQVNKTKQVVELWKVSDRPGIQEFKRLIAGMNSPGMNDEDINLAVKVHGLHDHTSVQGKATRWKSGEIQVEELTKVKNTQHMLCDVVYQYRENPKLTTGYPAQRPNSSGPQDGPR